MKQYFFISQNYLCSTKLMSGPLVMSYFWICPCLVALLYYLRHHFLRSFICWSSCISLTYSSSNIICLFIFLWHIHILVLTELYIMIFTVMRKKVDEPDVDWFILKMLVSFMFGRFWCGSRCWKFCCIIFLVDLYLYKMVLYIISTPITIFFTSFF